MIKMLLMTVVYLFVFMIGLYISLAVICAVMSIMDYIEEVLKHD